MKVHENTVAQSILNAYELKCQGKRTREELEAMMDEETWFPVREAVDAGLVDEIIGGAGLLPSQGVNAVGGGLRARREAMDGGTLRPDKDGDPPASRSEQESERERLAVSLSVKKHNIIRRTMKWIFRRL